jgi:hypothetical protein
MPASAPVAWNGTIQPVDSSDLRVAHLVERLWRDHFADVPCVNTVQAGYGYPWKRRLGRIRMTLDEEVSEILLNGLLDSHLVPDLVRMAILAHELVHYAQGFGSPLPRPYAHAHAHGTVTRELERRGLGWSERALDAWAQQAWPAFAESERQRRQSVRQALPVLTCATTQNVVYWS